MNKIAKIVGWVMHPFFVPIYLLLVILVFSPFKRLLPIETLWGTWLIVIFSSIIIPFAVIVALKHFKVIKSITLDDREDRAWPMLVEGVMLALGSLILMLFPMAESFTTIMSVISLLILLGAFITLYWKISVHAMVWGAVCGIFLIFGPLLKWAFIASIIIAGVVCTSRLLLGKHNGWQVLAGFMCGIVMTTLLLSI